nr:hypothetical protein [Tanacetum cinerariifolium]
SEHNTDFHPMVDFIEASPLRQYTQRDNIAQSYALPTVADELASPQRDVSQGEAYPTDSGFIADQDRATIDKSSTMPHDLVPRVTSPVADEGSMQQTIPKLTALCTSLQRQLSELTDKFQAQEVEINRLKERVKMLEDRKGVAATRSGDNAPIKGRSMNVGEAATERISEDTEEMATVLTSIDAATVLASRVVDIPTSSDSFPLLVLLLKSKRRKGKEIMVVSETLKKQKVQEQIDAQVARELEEKLEREDQRRSEQIARDADITRIHVEEELQIMNDSLDRNNETVAKYLQEYHQFALELPFERRIELISDLVKYQDHYAKEQIEGGVSKISKEEAAWLKRKGIRLEQEEVKKMKTLKEVPEEVKKVHTEGQRAYWKITRLGGSSASYQFFTDLLKHLDRDDLNQLWSLVKETLSNRPLTSDKEMELWVELSRLYESDNEDQLWTHIQNLMHAPVELKLYDTCGVHHVTSKDKEIFMLVEKDCPLRKGLALMMISYKLQVKNYSQMANDLILKIYKIANSPRQQGD